jgi:hypothetical protein
MVLKVFDRFASRQTLSHGRAQALAAAGVETTREVAVWNEKVGFAMFMTWNGLRIYDLLDNGNTVTIDWWQDVYQHEVGPWCERQFPDGWGNYADNASYHCQGTQASEVNKQEMLMILADFGGQPVEPPPRRPDMNCIENMNKTVQCGMWRYLRYRGIGRPTPQQIKEAAYSTVQCFPLEFVRNTITSMWCDRKSGEFTGSRFHRLIESKGKPIDVNRTR